ncbi:hypothetical protein JL721_7257 [Aureococcus anophagefferens]|nr:hypothetical protein JL721_7257 [Aureococcus anophagefferens]
MEPPPPSDAPPNPPSPPAASRAASDAGSAVYGEFPHPGAQSPALATTYSVMSEVSTGTERAGDPRKRDRTESDEVAAAAAKAPRTDAPPAADAFDAAAPPTRAARAPPDAAARVKQTDDAVNAALEAFAASTQALRGQPKPPPAAPPPRAGAEAAAAAGRRAAAPAAAPGAKPSQPAPRWHESGSAMPDNGDQVRKIYVSNLDYKTNERDVKRIFERFGAIKEVFMPLHPEFGRSRGFCFVTFAEEADAATAIEKMDGGDHEGRQLRVSRPEVRGKERQERGPPRTTAAPLTAAVTAARPRATRATGRAATADPAAATSAAAAATAAAAAATTAPGRRLRRQGGGYGGQGGGYGGQGGGYGGQGGGYGGQGGGYGGGGYGGPPPQQQYPPQQAASSTCASAAPAAIERLELAFAPHATTNLVAGERVFVMKSKGKNGQRPFAAAVVGDAAPADDGRVPVVYGDGSSYLVRPANLVRIHRGAGPRTLFCNETREYRLAAKTQVFDGDRVLEIGCDLGATTKALVARGAAVVAVDKARDRLAAAAADVRGATFLACDVLAHPATAAAAAPASDVVFVDINGSREYDAVDACVRWAEATWPAALVVCKSVAYMRRHFPESQSAEAPRRQRPS